MNVEIVISILIVYCLLVSISLNYAFRSIKAIGKQIKILEDSLDIKYQATLDMMLPLLLKDAVEEENFEDAEFIKRKIAERSAKKN